MPRTICIAAVSAVALLLAILGTAFPAVAGGRNQGGMLILHCNQTLEFTTDGDFNGYSELYECKSAVTQVPGEGEGVVYFVIAAFDDFAMPQIQAVDFGIELSSPTVKPVSWGVSGWDFFDIADDTWPASGTGIGIMWLEPLTRRLSEICWFAGYAYSGQTVKLVRHPLQGGYFVDNSTPRERERIEGYGMLGFGVPGFNPCRDPLPAGACCSQSERCILQTEAGCGLYAGYTYRGDGTVCAPNPCSLPPGACCVRSECRLIPWDECLDAHGIFLGDGLGCEGAPCGAPPHAAANGPNPFGASTAVRFELPQAGLVRLDIFDAAGLLVRTLGGETLPAGSNSLTWDGTDSRGDAVVTGVYFLRLTTPEGRSVVKRIRVR